MNDTRTQTGRKTSFQLCFLGSNSHGKELAPPEESPVILMALLDEAGRLSFFVDPNWQSLVHKADVQEIGLLLEDFAEGARSNADALFRQICRLNFGFLVTVKVETKIADPSAAFALYPHFVLL